MIPTHKLNRLSQEETDILLYCLNDGLSGADARVPVDFLNCARLEIAFKKLNEYASKVSEEKRITLQSIADKITNP